MARARGAKHRFAHRFRWVVWGVHRTRPVSCRFGPAVWRRDRRLRWILGCRDVGGRLEGLARAGRLIPYPAAHTRRSSAGAVGLGLFFVITLTIPSFSM